MQTFGVIRVVNNILNREHCNIILKWQFAVQVQKIIFAHLQVLLTL